MPLGRNFADRAGDHLHVDAALRQDRQQRVQFAVAHERFAADDRHVERPLPVDDPEHAVDQLLPLEVADLAQRDVAAEVVVAVGVASGALQRALAGDFERQRRCVSGQDPSPRAQDPIHLFTIMHAMKRRTLLQWLGGVAGAAATVPLRAIRVFAQPRELTHESVATLYEIAATVLPASLGATRVRAIADKFVAWTRGYREGVALVARLRASAPAAIRRVAGAGLHRTARGPGRRGERERCAVAGARPRHAPPAARRGAGEGQRSRTAARGRPASTSSSDLMAFYFRSSEANDVCYSAMINREVCRPIAITTRKPAPLSHV